MTEKYLTIKEVTEKMQPFCSKLLTSELVLKICEKNSLGVFGDNGYLVEEKSLNRFLNGMAQ